MSWQPVSLYCFVKYKLDSVSLVFTHGHGAVWQKTMKCVPSFVPAEALAQDLMTLIAVISLALGGEAQMLFGHGHTQ